MSTVTQSNLEDLLSQVQSNSNNVSFKNKLIWPIKRPSHHYSFPALHVLDCDQNNLTDLDYSLIMNAIDAPLTMLKVSGNELTSLQPLPKFPQLRGL